MSFTESKDIGEQKDEELEATLKQIVEIVNKAKLGDGVWRSETGLKGSPQVDLVRGACSLTRAAIEAGATDEQLNEITGD